MKRIPVREFMNPEPITVDSGMRLTEFVSALDHHGVRALCVADDSDRLVRVVSEAGREQVPVVCPD